MAQPYDTDLALSICQSMRYPYCAAALHLGPMHVPSLGSPSRRRLTTAAVLVGQVVAAFEGTVVTSAMPTIARELGGLRSYGWAFSSFLVASTIAVLACGRLADTFGRRPVYVAGMALFLTGSCLCGVATSFGALVAFRCVQGAGAGALLPIAMTISADLYSLQERARVQALLTSAWGAANLAGPLLGGWIVSHASWRWVFFVNVPVGALAVLLLVASYRDPVRRGATVRPAASDLLGAPAVRAGLVGAAFTGAILYAATAYVPLWVAARAGGDALHAGAALLPLLLGWSLGSSFGVRALLARGMRVAVTSAFAIALAGALAFTIAVGRNESGWLAMAALGIVGLGVGPAASVSLVASQTAVAWAGRGVVTSAVYAVRMLGGSLAVAALGDAGGVAQGAALPRFGTMAAFALAGLAATAYIAPGALAPRLDSRASCSRGRPLELPQLDSRASEGAPAE
jgi:MFS family permease